MAEMKLGENCPIMVGDTVVNDIVVEIGWTVAVASNFEIDVCCFLLTQEKKVRNDKDFIFYNQPSSVDGSIVLNTSPGNFNKSEIYISLEKIPSEIVRLVVAVTIYQAEKRQQNFSMVDHLYIRIKSKGSDPQQISYYELHDTNHGATQILGNIYKVKNSWNFCAGGQRFKVGLDILADKLGVNVLTENIETPSDVGTKARRNRHSIAKNKEDSVHIFQEKFISFLPQINAAVEQKDNESKTRMILDRIFTDVFGYNFDEIKAEQKIQGRKADYILSVDGEDVIVVEVKRAGMTLREKQIFQATSYGAYSGIKWALLTNLEQWQVYFISFQDRVEANLFFSVDFKNGLSADDWKNLLLISRYWISKDNILEKFWNEVQALKRSNIIESIMSDDVIKKIRSTVNRNSGCNISHENIQKAVEEALGITTL
jgi:stress response protein SCP2/predicted type IV restriction endonuclease